MFELVLKLFFDGLLFEDKQSSEFERVDKCQIYLLFSPIYLGHILACFESNPMEISQFTTTIK